MYVIITGAERGAVITEVWQPFLVHSMLLVGGKFYFSPRLGSKVAVRIQEMLQLLVCCGCAAMPFGMLSVLHSVEFRLQQ